MCKPGTHIKFCTCSETTKKELSLAPQIEKKEFKIGQLVPEADTKYFWVLSTYIGKRKSVKMGSMQGPSSHVGEDLDRDYIIEQLNTYDCFDFDYTPAENDYITIRPNTHNYLFDYILVKYSDGKWQSGFLNSFTDMVKVKKKGKIKFEEGEGKLLEKEKPENFFNRILRFVGLKQNN